MFHTEGIDLFGYQQKIKITEITTFTSTSQLKYVYVGIDVFLQFYNHFQNHRINKTT
jgi:hypothetical protein